MNNITGLIATAIVATIGIIKFKLIEELVRKISADDQKAKGYAILLLSTVIIVLAAISISLEDPGKSDSIEPSPVETTAATVIPKSDLEIKVDAAKDGIAVTEKLVSQAKERSELRIAPSPPRARRDGFTRSAIGPMTTKSIARTGKLPSFQDVKMIRQELPL